MINTGKSFGLFGNYHSEHILHGINGTIIKFIWTLLHSPNIIFKSVMRSATTNGYSH